MTGVAWDKRNGAEQSYPDLPLEAGGAWRCLIALCIGFFMILLDQTIVAVATPAIQRDLGGDYGQIIWVTSVYLLCFAVPLLVTGRLGDRWGPKNLYIAGMVIFTLSSLWCGLAGSVEQLIIARGVQGIGASLLTPQTMSVINRVFPRNKRGAALGIWGSTAGLSTLTGPLLGGFITGFAGWHWVFFINVPIGVLSVAMVAAWVPRFKPSEKPIDPLSIVLSIVTMTSLIYAIQEGQRAGWAWWIWGLFLLAAVCLFFFIRRQEAVLHTGRDALIPLDLFRRKHFAFGNISIFAMGFTVAGMMVPVMLFLQQVHGLEPLTAGLMMTPMSLLAFFLSPLVGRAVDKHDPRPLAVAGFGVMALGLAVMVTVMMTGVSHWWVLVSSVILGVGNPLVWAPNSTTTLRDLPPRFAGAGSGMYNTTRQLGAVTGAAIIGLVLQVRMVGLPADDAGQAFGAALIPAVLLLGVGMWGAWRAVEPRSVD
ncbi:Multidrug resistance protein stp [Corynebacterium urogenitale]|uniref:Multidrug resistance protein stp n=1 Tax=Corynebacterium urogenitale TaxID=2487892 RepID=A0A5J6ZAV8_9CORY|nr:DHA2 family efflux MFS transporter permease subunit [Corynebacterium urogenitale]QFQ02667.1 Multidrug resistance protein stp [Corynebacterium urogenitale]